jgi:hypothetical protein
MLVEALFAKLANAKSARPTRVCNRCGLSYTAAEETCSHCGDLQGLELVKFLERLEEDRADIANLGEFFYLCSSLVLFVAIMIMAN